MTSSYEIEVAQRYAEAAKDYLTIAQVPQRWASVRARLRDFADELDPIYRGRIIDVLIERLAKERLQRNGCMVREDDLGHEWWSLTEVGS